MQKNYEAININGKRIKTKYSPDQIMRVSELLLKKTTLNEIALITGVAEKSIRFVKDYDPLDPVPINE